MNDNAYIHSISYYLPESVLTNDDLALVYNDWNGDKVLSKTGIARRHISAENELASDMAAMAALKLFEDGDISPECIDFIILCTQSPDYLLPTTACILQEKLNVPVNCGALDINLGCSGFVYGLALSKSLIFTGVASNVLLVMSETYTKHINAMDKSTRTIFGDGAAAVLIRGGSEAKIGQFVLGTDGKGAKNLIVPSGGLKLKRCIATAQEIEDESGNIRSQDNLYMNGPEIFSFTINTIPGLVNNVLTKNLLGMDNIDLFVFHQANKFMLEHLRKILNIPVHKFYVNMTDIGNTVSATIPIALKMAQDDGVLKPGNTVMLVGFGVGYSWGATIIKW